MQSGALKNALNAEKNSSTMTEKLDKTDIQILKALQENGRITVKDLALKVHLSTTPVFERMRRLESEGYIQRYTEVAECYNISGDFDFLLKIYAPDMQYYNDFLINTLGTIESLGSVQSCFVMNEVKNSYGLPVSLL